MSLEQSVILVTGGGTGIGLASAQALAQAGARIVITGRREEPLRNAVASISGDHPVRYRTADMADPEQVQELVDWVHSEVGVIDILVNNHGVNVQERSLDKLSTRNWDYIMQVNANGAFYVVQAVLPGHARTWVWPDHQHFVYGRRATEAAWQALPTVRRNTQ